MSVKDFLFAFLIIKGAHGCLNQTFTNTSVTLSGVRKPITSINGCFGPEQNIERVSLIQILDENVPVLYEDAFNNLSYLLDIILENDRITRVNPGAFKNLPKLYSIKIRGNEIGEIGEGIFSNLPLTELNLANNKIERIHTRAFNNMPNLSIILLGGNKITTLDPDWFEASPKINVLNLENNLIRYIPRRAFKNIQGLHRVNNLNVSTSLHLNENKIENIEDEAFEGLTTLGWLFLQRNQINQFNENSLGHLQQLDWVRLDHNNLECIPKRLLDIAPNVKYYLEGNPLTEDCMEKLDIKRKTNGQRVNFFNVSIH